MNYGRADKQNGSRDGSRLYEVYKLMLNFGRGMPRPQTVNETQQIKTTHASAARSKKLATQKSSKKGHGHEQLMMKGEHRNPLQKHYIRKAFDLK